MYFHTKKYEVLVSKLKATSKQPPNHIPLELQAFWGANEKAYSMGAWLSSTVPVSTCVNPGFSTQPPFSKGMGLEAGWLTCNGPLLILNDKPKHYVLRIQPRKYCIYKTQVDYPSMVQEPLLRIKVTVYQVCNKHCIRQGKYWCNNVK